MGCGASKDAGTTAVAAAAESAAAPTSGGGGTAGRIRLLLGGRHDQRKKQLSLDASARSATYGCTGSSEDDRGDNNNAPARVVADVDASNNNSASGGVDDSHRSSASTSSSRWRGMVRERYGGHRRRRHRTKDLFVRLLFVGDEAPSISRQLRLEWGGWPPLPGEEDVGEGEDGGDEEELRTYGVYVRANIFRDAVRICLHLESTGLCDLLDLERRYGGTAAGSEDAKAEISSDVKELWSRVENEGLDLFFKKNSMDKDGKATGAGSTGGGDGRKTALDAYQRLHEALEEEAASGNGDTAPSCCWETHPLSDGDWVGESSRAAASANRDAKLFLKHWPDIRSLCAVGIFFVSATETYCPSLSPFLSVSN